MAMKLLGYAILLCLAPTPAFAAKDVVVILSEANELQLKDGKKAPTGVYLNELMIPVMKLLDHQHTLVFATPNGKAPTFDADSDNVKYFGGDKKQLQRAHDLLTELRITGPKASLLKFSDLNKKKMDEVAGIFVPGGHAPMVDLSGNQELGQFLRSAHEKKIPTALICHGPIAILSALQDPAAFLLALSAGNVEKAQELGNGWIYAGYKMVIFSTPEEKVAEEKKLKGQMLFYPDDALRLAGGKIANAVAGKSNVVQDRELLTGQNPASAVEFARALAQMLRTSKK